MQPTARHRHFEVHGLVEAERSWTAHSACYHGPMPKLIVEASPVGPDKEVDVPDGGDLVDVSDETLLPIPFSCRSASCGTCQIEVVEGAELLEEPEEDESDLLDLIGGSSRSRLACQARLKPGPGLVRVRPV